MWHYSPWTELHLCRYLIFIPVRLQVEPLISIIYASLYFFFFTLRATLLFTTPRQILKVSAAKELVENQRSPDSVPSLLRALLTVATLETIYEGFFKRRSVADTANFFHSGSDWRRRQERGAGGRGGGGGRGRRHRQRDRAVSSINLCILIHILATSLISVSPASFQISLHFDGRMFSRVLTRTRLPPPLPSVWC